MVTSLIFEIEELTTHSVVTSFIQDWGLDKGTYHQEW